MSGTFVRKYFSCIFTAEYVIDMYQTEERDRILCSTSKTWMGLKLSDLNHLKKIEILTKD